MAGRRLLLWSGVTSLVLQLAVAELCALSCCSGQPRCAEAHHVTCDCPQLDAVTLGKSDIPPFARLLYIQRVGAMVDGYLVHSELQQTRPQAQAVQSPGSHVLTDLDGSGTAVRRPDGANTSGPAVLSLAQRQHKHRHRLVLYLTLGAVLAVLVVLVVLATVLVVKLCRRRRDRRSSGPETPPVVETALMVIANRLLRWEDERGGGGGRPGALHTARRSSVESHQYETIRPEMLQPPPHYQPLIGLEDNSGDNLLRRCGGGGGLPDASPSAGRSSVDNHDYLAIRPEMLQPPRYETLNRLDQDNSGDNRQSTTDSLYCHLMHR